MHLSNEKLLYEVISFSTLGFLEQRLTISRRYLLGEIPNLAVHQGHLRLEGGEFGKNTDFQAPPSPTESELWGEIQKCVF